MLHYFGGEVRLFGKQKYLLNDLMGIEVAYHGLQKKWWFFLFPYLDDNRKTVSYFAFDSSAQKVMFEKLLKISGIGPKTAFQMTKLPVLKIEDAIKDLDVKFFQNIPGIGPKTAKKILLELKDSFEVKDLDKIEIDEKLYKNIVSSLKTFGYEVASIKAVLQKYEWKIDKKNMWEVIKWVIANL